MHNDDLGFYGMMVIVFAFVAIVVAGGFIMNTDVNGFSCPAGSQTVWEDDEVGEIEGCILPGGKFMDDPAD